MFLQYENEQPIAIKTLTNAIKEQKLSHAYIFETNNYPKAYDFIIDFIKYIECPKYESINHIEEKCNICSAINNNNYIELKIINPETIQIKKEEMIELQHEFKNKVLEGNKKIYLIKNAERLNSSSANTILKFLEEPEDNIIAILMTSSRYSLLSTILSRCQIISFINSKSYDNLLIKLYNNYYSSIEFDEQLEKKIENNVINILHFVENVEKNKLETLLFTSEYFLKYFKTREDIFMAFEIIKMIYYDMLQYKINNYLKYFDKNKDTIIELSSNNDINMLSVKLDIVMKTIDKIKYNVNTSLLLDKFIMDIGGNYCD